MKFYNPFKPHIVLGNDGYYYVRAIMLSCGWVFLMKQNEVAYEKGIWYLKSSKFLDECAFEYYIDAERALNAINNYKKPKKFKVIKVLNDA